MFSSQVASRSCQQYDMIIPVAFRSIFSYYLLRSVPSKLGKIARGEVWHDTMAGLNHLIERFSLVAYLSHSNTVA